MLKLMYITNKPEIAAIAERNGVDRIFIDMEWIGKSDRQGGMDTVQLHHTVEDVANIRNIVKKAEVLVRVNPIHEASSEYCSSEDEINSVIKAGADVVMLPYFKTTNEVEIFTWYVGNRAKKLLLLETPQAVEKLDEILKIPGIDEIHIGLNDLSLGMNKKFMFELLADGTVEALSKKIKKAEIPFGIGGIANLDGGMLPGRYIIGEHYRLGSQMAILSRSFYNTDKMKSLDEAEECFNSGIKAIRDYEIYLQNQGDEFFAENYKILSEKIGLIINRTV